MGPFSAFIHKALLPVNGRAVISHIIQKFPEDTRFVIAVHHFENQIKDYIGLAHPLTAVDYVYIPVISGANSGPGVSLFQCKERLDSPFYLVCADTLWNESFAELSQWNHSNWIATAPTPSTERKNYCNLEFDTNRKVTTVWDKVEGPSNAAMEAFTGLAYIRDYKLFFEKFNPQQVSNEVQISSGFRPLIENSTVLARSTSWIDTGTYKKYCEANNNDLSFLKTTDLTYFVNNFVIKFFLNPDHAKKRVAKAELSPQYFPPGISQRGHFLKYDYVEGKNLYQRSKASDVDDLLQWMERIWSIPVPQYNQNDARSDIYSFYIERTLRRIDSFTEQFGNSWLLEKQINGQNCCNLIEKIYMLSPEQFHESTLAFIHGDLTLGNTIKDESGKITLIDWRQDFGKNQTYGDKALDLSKLAISCMIQLESAQRTQKEDLSLALPQINLFWPKPSSSLSMMKSILRYANKSGISTNHLRRLIGLSLLSMAGAQTGQVAKLYFLLGWNLLERSHAKDSLRLASDHKTG